MLDPFVLVVDDDPEMAACLAEALDAEHCRTVVATDGLQALKQCAEHRFDAVLSDVRMPRMDGMQLLSRLRREQPDVPVILVTGDGSISAAVETVKRGAFQYVTKPCSPAELRRIIDQAVLSRPRLERTTRAVMPVPPRGTEEIVGDSAPMKQLRARIELVAAATSPVLVLGETGTGKELVAHAIHACSLRAAHPFVTVNTAAIPETLLESEIFGHVRGAFTGATNAHGGVLAEADGGTLLLDEIGDMPLGLQAKLLRVLQEGEVRAVGSERPRRVDVRIVAATHRNLPTLVKEGRFREDLYYRLNVVSLVVPPLRARASDIPTLAVRFLERARERAPHSPVSSMSRELLDLLSQGSWPGNVRELQSTIERLVVLGLAERLEPEHLRLGEEDVEAWSPPSTSTWTPLSDAEPVADIGSSGLDQVVRRHVESVLARTNGNKSSAAKILGIDLSTLYRWQQKWKP